ncbi:uncharacterized protein GIQ15_05496 [Arthroderma uncinatum]|uniref:uncharacterized protein n=1 Tax=Arthroderma uncinatum TaxID=74035 RepID=UPI00144AF3EB|nr:uncharacterized protein GIQ15_05496 [Arthroderma uncinatum]KAF3480149.1 hypothetical protein GIQ15_05496 [Arthroderma uncinatum]
MALDLENGVDKDLSTTETSPLPAHGSRVPRKATQDGYGGVIGDESSSTEDDTSSGISVSKQVEMEADQAIKYRTCSWQKTANHGVRTYQTAALLFSEYICLAIMSFPYSYSVLGLVPGLILTVVVAGMVLYTSLIIWKYCLRHPDVRDICDIGQRLFWGSRAAWYLTAIMFLLNNTFIQGLHCLVGAQYLNTMTNHSTCTVVFVAVTAIISFFCSIPRTFNTLSKLATLSAFFTFISVLLAMIFAGLEAHPAKYNPDPNHKGPDGKPRGGEPIVTAFPLPGTTFVAGMSAFLNISYTFIGQITLPSFIAEMRNPRDFSKALWAVTIAEIIVFSIVGAVVYVFTGTQYMTAPAFGSLSNEVYKKVAFSFMVPTLIFLGVLYASVSARFIFFRLFDNTRHKTDHTLAGWSAWAGILAVVWILAFIVAEVIPFFTDLLSIMSSLFDSFFGFIFWGVAYLRMQSEDEAAKPGKARSMKGWIGWGINVFLIGVGLLFLGPGTYASIDSVVLNYQSGKVGSAFSYSRGWMSVFAMKPIARVPQFVSGRVLQASANSKCWTGATLGAQLSRHSRQLHGAPIFRYRQPLVVNTASGKPSGVRYASSSSAADADIKKTQFYDFHVEHKGKMVPFAGYSMPLQYADLSHLESHKWTREKSSLFDVSHMVQHHIIGPGARDLLMKITPASLDSLKDNHSTLSCLLDESTGGIVDDTIVTRLGPESFYFVTNAGRRKEDLEFLTKEIEAFRNSQDPSKRESIINWSILDSRALLALQGPASAKALQSLIKKEASVETDLSTLYFGQCRQLHLTFPDGSSTPSRLLISRTGYTGEDGFEISIPTEKDANLPRRIAELLISNPDVKLAGLAARDSLRLEAGMCLYGHDISLSETPPVAGLGWVVGKDRRDPSSPLSKFNGSSTILPQLVSPAKTLTRRRVGFTVEGGAPAREGATIVDLADGKTEIGVVTSGLPSPTLGGTNIAMGYIKQGLHKKGTEVGVLVRKKLRKATVTPMPWIESKFYRG